MLKLLSSWVCLLLYLNMQAAGVAGKKEEGAAQHDMVDLKSPSSDFRFAESPSNNIDPDSVLAKGNLVLPMRATECDFTQLTILVKPHCEDGDLPRPPFADPVEIQNCDMDDVYAACLRYQNQAKAERKKKKEEENKLADGDLPRPPAKDREPISLEEILEKLRTEHLAFRKREPHWEMIARPGISWKYYKGIPGVIGSQNEAGDTTVIDTSEVPLQIRAQVDPKLTIPTAGCETSKKPAVQSLQAYLHSDTKKHPSTPSSNVRELKDIQQSDFVVKTPLASVRYSTSVGDTPNYKKLQAQLDEELRTDMTKVYGS